MSKKPSPKPRMAASQKTSPPLKKKASFFSFQLQTAKLPVLLVFFLLAWLWAGWYYGSVFSISREYSFWVADTRIMEFVLCQPYGTPPIREAAREIRGGDFEETQYVFKHFPPKDFAVKQILRIFAT